MNYDNDDDDDDVNRFPWLFCVFTHLSTYPCARLLCPCWPSNSLPPPSSSSFSSKEHNKIQQEEEEGIKRKWKKSCDSTRTVLSNTHATRPAPLSSSFFLAKIRITVQYSIWIKTRNGRGRQWWTISEHGTNFYEWAGAFFVNWN